MTNSVGRRWRRLGEQEAEAAAAAFGRAARGQHVDAARPRRHLGEVRVRVRVLGGGLGSGSGSGVGVRRVSEKGEG